MQGQLVAINRRLALEVRVHCEHVSRVGGGNRITGAGQRRQPLAPVPGPLRQDPEAPLHLVAGIPIQVRQDASGLPVVCMLPEVVVLHVSIPFIVVRLQGMREISSQRSTRSQSESEIIVGTILRTQVHLQGFGRSRRDNLDQSRRPVSPESRSLRTPVNEHPLDSQQLGRVGKGIRRGHVVHIVSHRRRTEKHRVPLTTKGHIVPVPPRVAVREIQVRHQPRQILQRLNLVELHILRREHRSPRLDGSLQPVPEHHSWRQGQHILSPPPRTARHHRHYQDKSHHRAEVSTIYPSGQSRRPPAVKSLKVECPRSKVATTCDPSQTPRLKVPDKRLSIHS